MMEQYEDVHRYINGFKGALWRKGQINGVWKLRYFVLEQKQVQCFDDAQCTKLVSEFTLSKHSNVYDIPDEPSEERKNCFYISGTLDEVYFLSAESAEQKYEWIEALLDAQHNGFKLVNQEKIGFDPFYPTVHMKVSYENNTFFACYANKLPTKALLQQPAIELCLGKSDSIYSLLMLDLDSIRTNHSNNVSYVHWCVVNIEGTDVESGIEVRKHSIFGGGGCAFYDLFVCLFFVY
jgi:hypothetical protein